MFVGFINCSGGFSHETLGKNAMTSKRLLLPPVEATEILQTIRFRNLLLMGTPLGKSHELLDFPIDDPDALLATDLTRHPDDESVPELALVDSFHAKTLLVPKNIHGKPLFLNLKEQQYLARDIISASFNLQTYLYFERKSFLSSSKFPLIIASRIFLTKLIRKYRLCIDPRVPPSISCAR